MKVIISSFSYKAKNKIKIKLDKHIVFSWKTTIKRAELAGELTELFHTLIKTGCCHPSVTNNVEWGPHCPCCPLGRAGGRPSHLGVGMGTKWGYLGQFGLFSTQGELPALKIELLMLEHCMRLPCLLPAEQEES